MTYAVIRDGVVVNLIWLFSTNEEDFPEAVPVNSLPVCVGDSYEDGSFYRNGQKLLPVMETTLNEKADMQQALETVGVTLNG